MECTQERNLRYLLFLAVHVLFSIQAVAAQAPLSLADLYQQALTKNETVLTQNELFTQRDEQATQALAPMLPQLSTSALLLKQTEVSNPASAQFSPANQTTLKVGVTQSLFRGLRDFAQLHRQNTMAQAQTNLRDASMIQLYVDLAQSYVTCLQLLSDVQLMSQEIQINRKRLEELRGFQSRGRNRQAELFSLESTVATLEAQWELLRGQLEGAQEQLAFVSGLNGGQRISVENISREGLPKAAPLPEGLDSKALESDIERRSEVAAARLELDAADSGVSMARAGHLPTADASANYYFMRPGLFADIKWDVQLTATLPLYSGGGTQSQVRQAASERKTKELQLARLRRQVEQEIRTYWAALQADSRQIEKLSNAVELTGKSYQIEQRNYRSGLSTVLEVLQTHALWVQAQRNMERVKLTQTLDWIRLEAARGRLPIPSNKQ